MKDIGTCKECRWCKERKFCQKTSAFCGTGLKFYDGFICEVLPENVEVQEGGRCIHWEAKDE